MVELAYLDTNVYCRPVDDQSNPRIHAEAQAFLEIVDAAERGEMEIISSDYVKFEIEQIQDSLKRKDVRGFERILSKTNVTSRRRLTALSREFILKCRVGSLDALHLAAACWGKADFFLTCDEGIIDHVACIEKLASEKGYKLKVSNPINYMKVRRKMKK